MHFNIYASRIIILHARAGIVHCLSALFWGGARYHPVSSFLFLFMTLDVLTFGLNHVSAPVEVRERVAFPMNVVRPALDALRSTFGTSVSEAAILSTCKDRKSTRLNSSHVAISYSVFCL